MTLTTFYREAEEKFSWAEICRGVFSPQTWLTASAYFGILSGLYSFGLFVRTYPSKAWKCPSS